MFLSHILYKVEDLPRAIDQLAEAGFSIHVPGDLHSAFHAMIWFEKGPYLELILPERSMVFPRWLMKITGYGLFVKRQKKWCDFGLESSSLDLNREKSILRENHIKFNEYQPKIKNEKGQIIKWKNIVTEDNELPFLVSAYNIDPRPPKIVHPNGATEVDKVFIGKHNLNLKVLNHLLTNKDWIALTEGKNIQNITLKGTSLRIERLLYS